MKQMKLLAAGLCCSCLLVGCRGDKAALLSADELKTNTFYIEKEGSIQAAMVEPFDKPYYDEEELKTYLQNDVIGKYNEEAGKDLVEMTSFAVKNNVAGAVFRYDKMEDYASLNETEASLLSLDEARDLLTAASFYNPEGEETAKEDVFADSDAKKLKVLILNEEYDVIVDGAIKYYANASLLDNKSVHTNADEPSFILYK